MRGGGYGTAVKKWLPPTVSRRLRSTGETILAGARRIAASGSLAAAVGERDDLRGSTPGCGVAKLVGLGQCGGQVAARIVVELYDTETVPTNATVVGELSELDGLLVQEDDLQDTIRSSLCYDGDVFFLHAPVPTRTAID